MLIVALKLLGLLLLLLPVLCALWAGWRRGWKSAPASECLLAALVCTPLLLIVEVVALGSIPLGRPLRLLIWLQLALTGLGVFLAWRQRAALRLALAQTAAGLAAGWRTAPWPQRAALILGLLTHAAAAAYGAWSAPSAWDELAYHVPQAVQPYQDGRLGPVQANIIWADSYPRGAALLYYWTLQLTHTDAGFHPVNAAFGFVFILATYVAAMRLGLGRSWAWLAAGIVPTAPIFAHLATVGYIDLSVAGALTVVLALALPERGGAWSWGSCAAMLSAAVLTLYMKFPPIALITVALGYRGLLIVTQTVLARRRPDHSRPRPAAIPYLAAAVLAMGLASIPYLHTWRTYGSPVYPLRLRVGSTVLIDGPMDTALFQRMNELPLLKRYWMFWSNWRTPVNPDSPGSFGPLFLLAMVGAALIAPLAELRTRRPGWLLIVAAFWLVVVLPEHHVPRYALYVLLPGALCAARVGQALNGTKLSGAWALAVVAATLANVNEVRRNAKHAIRWHRKFDIPLFTEARDQPAWQRSIQTSFAPTPETRLQVHAHMRPGETLVTAVAGLQALLHDYRYRYRVEHRPALAWPYGFIGAQDLTRGSAQAPAWLEGLRRDDIRGVLVYTQSAEDNVLRQPGSGYVCVHEQDALASERGIRFYMNDRTEPRP